MSERFFAVLIIQLFSTMGSLHVKYAHTTNGNVMYTRPIVHHININTQSIRYNLALVALVATTTENLFMSPAL